MNQNAIIMSLLNTNYLLIKFKPPKANVYKMSNNMITKYD